MSRVASKWRLPVIATCLFVLLSLLFLTTYAKGRAASAPIPVSIDNIKGAFYSNPNNSGAFDPSVLSGSAPSQSFPVIDFNPPTSAGIGCSTTVNPNTRPFTDVVPNPGGGGTCSTVATGQGGTPNNPVNFQAVFTANLTIGAMGDVTFNFFSDDGWILSSGPEQASNGSAQPKYSSGSLVNPPAKNSSGNSVGYVTGFLVVGAFNQPSAPTQTTVTVHYPSAGTYPIEIDYTECCFGALSLVLGTSAGNPITPQMPARPIIFIPGIISSYLANLPAEKTPSQEVWPQAQTLADCISVFNTAKQAKCDMEALQYLQLAPDGSSPSQPGAKWNVDVANGTNRPLIGTLGGAFDALSVKGEPTVHFYDVTAYNLEQSGYALALSDADLKACAATKKCFIPVGVDWRKGADFNAARVLTVIDHVLALTGADKVNILAHSQGGLIASALVKLPGSVNMIQGVPVGKVGRVVTMGTPYLGATKFLTQVVFQAPCELPVSEFGITGCLLDPSVLQKLARNFPGALELLPSAQYFNAAPQSPLVKVVNGVPTNITFPGYLLYLKTRGDLLNYALITQAERFHDTHDSWAPLDPKVQLLRMVGYDAGAGIGECDSASFCSDTELGIFEPGGANETIVTSDLEGHLITGIGDGTVPLYSASLFNPATKFDLRNGQHDLYYCAISHQGLAQSPVVWSNAKAFFEGTDFTDRIAQLCPGGTAGDLAGVSLN